jgi:hypothetical protein
MTRTFDMDLGKTLGSIGKIMFAVGFTAAIINLTGLFVEFSGGRIIELSAIGFAGFVLIGIGRKMKGKDKLNEKLDFDVKKNTDKNPDSETFAKNTDEEDSKP